MGMERIGNLPGARNEGEIVQTRERRFDEGAGTKGGKNAFDFAGQHANCRFTENMLELFRHLSPRPFNDSRHYLT